MVRRRCTPTSFHTTHSDRSHLLTKPWSYWLTFDHVSRNGHLVHFLQVLQQWILLWPACLGKRVIHLFSWSCWTYCCYLETNHHVLGVGFKTHGGCIQCCSDCLFFTMSRMLKSYENRLRFWFFVIVHTSVFWCLINPSGATSPSRSSR